MNGAIGARRAHGILTLGVVGAVVGILVILTTVDTPFFAVNSPDVRLLRILHLNAFGGLLVTIVGALAIAGGVRRRTGPALAAGAMTAIMALWSLVGLNTGLNLMSARADTFTLFLMLASGLLLFSLTPDPER